jgi:chemotaxis protein MotB
MSDEEEEEGGDSFRLLFVTLSMILLAFFILLNSMGTIDKNKKRTALGSLLGAFGLMPGSDSIASKKPTLSPEGISAVTADSGFAVFKKLKHMIDDLNAGNVDKATPAFVTYDEQTGEIKVIAADRLLFAPGKSTISPRMFSLLSELGKLAVKFDGRITVSGFSDSRGDKYANWHLSMTRAAVVARNIEASAKLRQGAISAIGHSYYKPVELPEVKEQHLTTRRVEIMLTPMSGGSAWGE